VAKINNVSTALAMVFVAFAAMLIGGLTMISPTTSTTMQSASAAGGGGHECNEILGEVVCHSGGSGCGPGGCGAGGNNEIIVDCGDADFCIHRESGGHADGRGGGGGGGLSTDCVRDPSTGEYVCERTPHGGGGGVGGGSN